MSLESVFYYFGRKFSLPLLVITLLFAYYTLPDLVAVHHNSSGKPDGFIGKNTFFYVMVCVIIAFNFVPVALKNAFLRLPTAVLPQNNAWTLNRPALNKVVETWTNLFVTLVNIYLIICTIALNRINRNEGQTLDINYNWVLLVGAFLLIILLFYLPIKLLFRSPSEES